MLVDFHLHSSASDGMHTPDEVVRLAAKRGMEIIALTDHDSIDGIAPAASTAAQAGVALIPGVEFSCEGSQEVHLLGYGLDIDSPVFHELFTRLQRERRERAAAIVSLLKGMGLRIEVTGVMNAATRSVSRTHIAQALVRAGAASSVHEAFQRFLSPGRPAYIPRTSLSLAEAVGLLRAEGAIPVLAHPGLLHMADGSVTQYITLWREQGLMGLEAYHPRHTPSQSRRFDALARSLGMLVTGGSDAHGEGVRHGQIGEGLAGWHTRDQDAATLWHLSAHTVGHPFAPDAHDAGITSAIAKQ